MAFFACTSLAFFAAACLPPRFGNEKAAGAAAGLAAALGVGFGFGAAGLGAALGVAALGMETALGISTLGISTLGNSTLGILASATADCTESMTFASISSSASTLAQRPPVLAASTPRET